MKNKTEIATNISLTPYRVKILERSATLHIKIWFVQVLSNANTGDQSTEFYRKIHNNGQITNKDVFIGWGIGTFWNRPRFLAWNLPRVNCDTNVGHNRLGLNLTTVIF